MLIERLSQLKRSKSYAEEHDSSGEHRAQLACHPQKKVNACLSPLHVRLFYPIDCVLGTHNRNGTLGQYDYFLKVFS